ncbi:hypothetical protein CLAIMM_07457 [Cladophialophora immunda]|nr:hypothetical protein CLAIMM_07457 [Cladophialophora immunda]
MATEKDVSQTTEIIENAAQIQERERQRAAEFEAPMQHIQELSEAEHVNLSFCRRGGRIRYCFIIRDLGDAPIAGWIIQGPLLMQSVLSPIVGRLSDVLDRKWLASIPPLIAFGGAVMSAKATSMSMLIGGGILIGVTLSTIAIVQAIPSEVLPLKYRALANGFAFLGGAVGGLVGILGSGGVTNQSPSGWRDIFWMQAAFHAATFIGLVLFYHPTRRSDYPKMTLKQYIWAIDPIGSFVFIVACTLLLLALDWAGGAYAWSDVHVAAPLGIGLGFLAIFCVYEWKGRSDGIVAHVFFKGSPNFALSVFAFAVEGWIFYSAVNSVTPQIVLNLGFQTNAWKISIRQLSYNLVTLFTSIPLTCICYAVITPNMNSAQIGFNVLSGIGQSGPLTLIVALIQFTAPHAFLSTATGLGFSARAIGGAFGSAVLDAIINGKLKSYPTTVGNAAVEAGLPTSSVPDLLTALTAGTGLSTVPGMNETIQAATLDASHSAYAHAYRLAWASIIPFVVLALIGIWFLKGVKELMTEKVEATVEHVNTEENIKA